LKEVRAKAALAMSAMGHAAAQYMALVTLAVKASHGCTASMLLWMTACCSQDENPEVWPPVLRIISRHLPEVWGLGRYWNVGRNIWIHLVGFPWYSRFSPLHPGGLDRSTYRDVHSCC